MSDYIENLNEDTEQNLKRDYGREFEEEVKNFLEDKFKFRDVKKNLVISLEGQKYEIDVCGKFCGKFGNILFVFQCRAAGKRSSPNLREKILAIEKRSRVLKENYREIPEFNDCKFVVFIFITKKIIVPEIQIKLLEEGNPKIWYADENVLEYYADLHDKIGDYAVYNFLSDFGVRPDETEQMHLTALKTKIENYNVYSFYVRPKHLLKFAYVARRRSNKEDFYQRMLEKSRIKGIQNYIDGGGIFPTNLIISIKKGERDFKPISCTNLPKHVEVGILTIKNSYNACWVIDGQHRLYSYAKSHSNSMMPCIAFDNISIEDEKGFFLSINKKQKPIQADLLWDLAGKINPKNNNEKNEWVISNSVRKLYNKKPFQEKIYIPVYGSKSGKVINMAAFCNGIRNAKLTSNVLPNSVGINNPIYINNEGTMVNRLSGILERFFDQISELCNEDTQKYFIFGNAGIPVMLYLLEPIVSRIGRIPNNEDLKVYTIHIANFFNENYSSSKQIRKLKLETNSEGARKELAKQIGTYIRKNKRDNNFWPKMEELDHVKEIINMERRIGKFISNKLSKISTSWEKQRIPNEIYKKAKRQAELDGTDFDENFDLGEERGIILTKNNWEEVFKNCFIGKGKFQNIGEIELAFLYLSKIRNPMLHGKSVVHTKEDFDQCNIYLQKFDRVIPELLSEDINSDEENNEIR